MLFPVLTAEWLHLGLCTSLTEYRISRRNIIILFCKYLADIISEAWLNLVWEHINGKLFAVRGNLYSIEHRGR
jgi:hypothetical protein